MPHTGQALFARMLLFSWLIGSGAAFSPARGEPLVPDAELAQLDLVRYWDLELPLATGDGVRAAWRLDDALYIATRQGVVYALDPVVGLVRWAELVAEANVHVFAPTHVMNAERTGPVAFITATTLQLRDRYTGRLTALLRPWFAPSAPIVGVDHLLVAASAGGSLLAFVPESPGGRGPVKLWELASGPVRAAPVLYADGYLLVASQRGRVSSCQVLDKTLNWTKDLGGGVVGDPAVDAGGVYVASLNRSLYKLDPGSGDQLWRYRSSIPLYQGPLLAGGLVIQRLDGQGLVAVDVDNGTQCWRHEQGVAPVGRTDDRVYLLTSGPKLEAVAADDGNVVGSIDAGEVAVVVTNGSNDFLYLLSAGGKLLCARPKGVSHLRPSDAAIARQRLNRPPAVAAEATAAEQPTAVEAEDDPFRSRRGH